MYYALIPGYAKNNLLKNLLTINGDIVHHFGELLLFRKKEET